MKAKIVPSFHYKDCISCSICVQACPVSAIALTHRAKQGKYVNDFPELVDYEGCIACRMCEKECPMDCINMASFYED